MDLRLMRIVFCWLICLSSVAVAQRPPNIIVFYSDDHGHADLSCQQVVDDIRTPHIDAMAAQGVLAAHGYSTAPQCVPSRAGLLVGKFQSKFGLESNGDALDGFNQETTIAKRLQQAGYVTAQFGKWHLGPTPQITDHGFQYVFAQNANRPFAANIDLDAEDRPMGTLKNQRYHIDGCSEAAAALIRRFSDQPLFLYVAYRAPHVPLDAPQKYLDRFPGEMPERRRQALAMLSAVDDGVGLVRKTLQECGLSEQTLVFFIGDNGAPLKIHKLDAPGGGPGWDGSLNDPLNGEKGMLSEGGMHVPFVISWPGKIQGGQVLSHPVSALDVAATAAAVAKLNVKGNDLDGVNLLPHLTGEAKTAPHDYLMWRWIAQSAVRDARYKYLRGGQREYLFDLQEDIEEKHNLLDQHPEIAKRLRTQLENWAETLKVRGLAIKPMSGTWEQYYDYYLDGKPASQPGAGPRSAARKDAGGAGRGGIGVSSPSIQGWFARYAKLSQRQQTLNVTPLEKTGNANVALIKSGFEVAQARALKLQCTTDQPGKVTVAWRLKGQKDFQAECRKVFTLTDSTPQTLQVDFDGDETLIHLRINLPKTGFTIKSADVLQQNREQSISLWPMKRIKD